jgi:glycosyltransferase involved in cell wall biosynthesis
MTSSNGNGAKPVIVHLLASPFLGGPEWQVLGMARGLVSRYRTVFLSFAERGLCQPFLEEARRLGFEAVQLERNWPHLAAAAREVARLVRRLRATVLICSGYKPDIVGWLAARQARVPVVSIAHGWTGVNRRVRLYDAADRWLLRWMDAVVAVSEGQAVKVRSAGVPNGRIHVIRNAVAVERFAAPQARYRQEIESYFPTPPQRIVGAAGRLSPEKGFDKLIDAAVQVVREKPGTGFVVFGEGPLRGALTAQVAKCGLQQHFILAGFRNNLELYLPQFDLLALPSYTEGLPVVVLEAFAAGVPVVGTTVGGVPEVIEDGVNGRLVPPGDAPALARSLCTVLQDDEGRLAMGQRGRLRVEEQFTFAAQARLYQRLFEQLAC